MKYKLHLGDWVKLEGKEIQVDENLLDAILCGYYDGIEFIPLTKEILEENGFKEIEEGSIYYDNNDFPFYISIVEGDTSFYYHYSIDYIGDIRCVFKCQYVHELQHLYDLCNKEFKMP